MNDPKRKELVYIRGEFEDVRMEIEDLLDRLDELRDELSSVREDEEDKYNDMSDNFQASVKGTLLLEAIGHLDSAMESVDKVDKGLQEAVKEFENVYVAIDKAMAIGLKKKKKWMQREK